MTIYAKVEEGGRVDHCDGVIDPPGMVGPPSPPPPGDGWMLITTLPGPRPHKDFAWKAVDGVMFWYDPRTLDQLRAEKAAELSTACTAYILAGFTSSALGAPHTYPSAILDQHNLNGLVTRSLYPGNPIGWTEKFWCADAGNVWARRDHTAVQLQQVGDEAITRITAAQAQCDALTAQANAATAGQIPGIVWTAP